MLFRCFCLHLPTAGCVLLQQMLLKHHWQFPALDMLLTLGRYVTCSLLVWIFLQCFIPIQVLLLLILLPFYGPLSRTTWVSWFQYKHSLNHNYADHQSSVICFLHLLQFMASSLFNLRAWQSLCTISVPSFLDLPLGLAPSTSYNHCLLFAAHTHTIATRFAVVLRLYHPILVCLSTLLGTFILMPHIHLTILISACCRNRMK